MASRDSSEQIADEQLLNWLRFNGIACTPTKLSRQFSDAVGVATLLKKFYPKLVDLHNYTPQSSVRLKLINWETLNAKVLSKLDLQQNKKSLENLARGERKAIEKFLLHIMNHEKEKDKNDDRGGGSSSNSGECLLLENTQNNQKLIVTVNKKVGDALVQVPQEMVLFSMYEKIAHDIERQSDLINNLKLKIIHLETDIEKKRCVMRQLMDHEEKVVASRISKLKTYNSSNNNNTTATDDGRSITNRSATSTTGGGLGGDVSRSVMNGHQMTASSSNMDALLNTANSSQITVDKTFSYLDVNKTGSPMATAVTLANCSQYTLDRSSSYNIQDIKHHNTRGGPEIDTISMKKTRIPRWNGRVVQTIREKANVKIEPKRNEMELIEEVGVEEMNLLKSKISSDVSSRIIENKSYSADILAAAAPPLPIPLPIPEAIKTTITSNPMDSQQQQQLLDVQDTSQSRLPDSMIPLKLSMGPFRTYSSNFNRFIANIKTLDSEIDNKTPVNTSLVYVECNRYKPNDRQNTVKNQLLPGAQKSSNEIGNNLHAAAASAIPTSIRSNYLLPSTGGVGVGGKAATTSLKSEKKNKVSTAVKAEAKSMVSIKELRDGSSVKHYNPKDKKTKKQ